MPSVRVKICGITRVEDAEIATKYGADAVGINFVPSSPRYVDPRSVTPLLRAVPPLMAAVGVYVGQPLRQVLAQAHSIGIRGVQWYGDDRDSGDSFPSSLIFAFRIRDTQHLEDIDQFLHNCRDKGMLPGAILVDAFVEGKMGGTGKIAPWELLAGFRPGVPLILAGGLNPDNVGDAIRLVKPAGVDVASGVESSPGKKDPIKVRDFIANARAASAEIGC